MLPAIAVMGLLLAGPPSPAPTSSAALNPVTGLTGVLAGGTGVLAGVYTNERGSRLTLEVSGTHLQGSFRSAVGNVASDTGFAVSGVVNGDVVGFVVDFGGAGSVGAWSGQLRGDDLVLLWHLSREVKDDEEKMGLWSSVLTGSDVFHRCRDCLP